MTNELRSLSAKELAAEIRAELRDVFPGQKFSVRKSEFSMGSSIDVDWKNGPDRAAVSAILDRYKGIGFDGRTDSTTHRRVTLRSGEVCHASSYIHAVREESMAVAS